MANIFCHDIVKSLVSRRTSKFDRLRFLAAFHNPATGRYADADLLTLFGEEEVNRVLRQAHQATFESWLSLNLEQQTADLKAHLSTYSHGQRREALREWLGEPSYLKLIPPGASAAQRRLFRCDLEVIFLFLYEEVL